jgi:hypothetical protein
VGAGRRARHNAVDETWEACEQASVSNAPSVITRDQRHRIGLLNRRQPVGLLESLGRRIRPNAMLDTQNQGPQCAACSSPVKLTATEPSSAKICEPLFARLAKGFDGTSLKPL